MIIDKLLCDPTYTNDTNGQIQKAKDALRQLEQIIGKQVWITMILTIIDFQQAKLTRPSLSFKAFDNAVKSFQKSGGM